MIFKNPLENVLKIFSAYLFNPVGILLMAVIGCENWLPFRTYSRVKSKGFSTDNSREIHAWTSPKSGTSGIPPHTFFYRFKENLAPSFSLIFRMCEDRWSVRCYSRAFGQKRRCWSGPHAAISRLRPPAHPAAAKEIRTGRLRTLRRAARPWAGAGERSGR